MELNTSLNRRFQTIWDAISDVFKGLSYWRLWTAMAWHTLTQRYKRSWIGIGWISLSFAIFTGVKIFIFGAIAGASIAYYAGFLTMGYLIFRFMTTSVTGGSNVFISAQSWIKSEPLPLTVHIYSLLTGNLITLGFAAIPALIICVANGTYDSMALVSLLPALLIYSINGIAVGLLFGVICARHRDLIHLVATAMQVLYFVSPILWIPPETGLRAQVAAYNPVTHYIAILRTPMIDGVIPFQSWLIVLACSFVVVTVGILTFAFARRKLIFWL